MPDVLQPTIFRAVFTVGYGLGDSHT